ncbi:MAG TPA: AraC family transcriptional regulator [Puia sp.]|jgi:AraC-like DNA-binding protein|nr:AraC family transcriptional regulator [Puia sp.]
MSSNTTPVSEIDTYGIKEVHADAGHEQRVNEFFVYNNEDITIREKMFHPARSTHFAIHLNLGSALEIKYNLINYSIPKNSLFIVHPGIIHVVKVVEHLPTISLGFTHDFLAASMLHKKHVDGLGFLSPQSDPLFLLSNEEAQTLYPMMVYLREMFYNNDHPFKEEMIYHGFNLFMLEVGSIARKYRANEEQGMTRKQDILMSFLKLLADHFKEERSVQFYANALYMTPKHLTKTVKEITTKTCGEFIDEMVIAEAKILLDDLSYSVGQVADYLHFSDQFFFSKFFKRRTGLSPKEYKNSL